ncbi:aminopeptidase P family protein [Miniphocaeibacter halophilus]|uniref:Aminopeptidase P family protein n=1 Tax=Miniphocaeibacter halophilus TaxID=2931922 RepID=A0AC61MPD9_9FIRM|nr:aminopeptidase P family protein [Miniphocaeibacter halophilus]QQK07402.1 aminopeptidase P family protein [Miniphocaeibacter halophilus]
MVKDRLKDLRDLMLKYNIDAYIVPTSDPHQSEYIADYYKTRKYISGFTGSAGTFVITNNKAGLWTDGRYFIQATKELDGSGIDLYKMGVEGTPTIIEFLNSEVEENGIVAFDGETYSYSAYLDLKKGLKNKKILSDRDLIGEIWKNRPSKPMDKIFLHDVNYAGITAKEKIAKVKDFMEKNNIDYYLLSSLDDISYLLNIRGLDVDYNPVIISYVLINKDKTTLFVDLKKVDKNIIENLKLNGVEVDEYEIIFEELKNLNSTKTIYFNPSRVNVKLFNSLPENINKKTGIDFTTNMKAVKNTIEIKNQRNAYIKDGVALVKFLNWVEENVSSNNEITEMDCSRRLLEFRKEQELFIEPSFETISAYGENAALPHYSPSDRSPVYLRSKGLYLVDSGGQYLDGTTDITRTIALGDVTEEESLHYTLTLKSHIRLMLAIFKKGTKSSALDIIARQPLWEKGIDFNHGTGHGVGYFLACHEGPQNISPRSNNINMVPGMITSNEPGVYIEGSHGIRIENIMLCIDKFQTNFGEFYGFESLSLCPIDTKPVIKELLTSEEIQWLNEYHNRCYEELSKYLNGEELEYLKEKTKVI